MRATFRLLGSAVVAAAFSIAASAADRDLSFSSSHVTGLSGSATAAGIIGTGGKANGIIGTGGKANGIIGTGGKAN